ncbi:ShlB/FhaC/HecB family hemolysin secretion/activation protein [Bradyrhizobium sp. SRL28]|uniref:ShlB/FhaC/HecB family hemolysin secretion/activation protein n=1 Tax=Bradyrhizobium sp. SRL28 TaxID=2836178 RepID=UPI001BDE3ACB|nr:ShlB/FhaC/HecB family hemolysin secretion/activation protein [Bradyrhizobium sp. SRL28]MBT1511631.1 ShlB/FhaC/HecB family hemolysin secretion/activation protein [Bradyrhizobium sp. SRL28]
MARGSTNDRRRVSVHLLKRICAPVAWHRFPTAGLGLWIIIACFPAQAQQANQPGYDPRQTEKRFEDQQSRQGPTARPRMPMPQFARPEGQGDSKPLFVLRHVSITGAVAIPQERLVTVYQPFIGRKVSQADLAAMAAAVSDIYRAAGFHLSRAIVPPQDIRSGQLRIQVIEGSITELALKGDGAEQFGVRPMLEAVLTERPSRLATLERQLLLINGRPGVRIEDTAIEEIGTASGHFRLLLSLKTWHVFTSFGVDNLGSSSVGPWQSYGTVAFNSYVAPGDSLVLNLSTTPGDPRQLAFGRLSYEVPVGTDGARIGASGYYSEVWPGDYRHLYSDNIKTESFEIRGSIVPLQSQKSSLTLTAAAGFTNASENDVFGPIYADRIRTASLTSDYRLQDDFGGTNYLTVNYRQGLDILGASHRGDDYLSRDGASGKFSALNFWFTRYQTLTDAWSLKLAAAGQAASGPLFTSQQFYLGGIAFGRGYGSAEISGDNGLAGSVELRFDQKLGLQYLSGYQLYGFVDSGVAWNSGYRLSDGLSLTSAGGGVRFFLVDGLQADIGAAAPLTYRAPDNPTRGARVLFSLTSALKLCPVRATTRCL